MIRSKLLNTYITNSEKTLIRLIQYHYIDLYMINILLLIAHPIYLLQMAPTIMKILQKAIPKEI